MLDEKLRNIFAANSPTEITEAARQLIAALVQVDPELPVEALPPPEPPL